MRRCVTALLMFSLALSAQEIVSFPSGTLTLRGVLFRPKGAGPFPAVVYNHGSAPDSSTASDALGPVFATHGWVLFMPSRRGQGLSKAAGPYIRDEINASIKSGGMPAGVATMIRLLETDHLNDQLAALAWLRTNDFVQSNRIAAAGTSFGGIETVLGAEKGSYCAAVDFSGGAESWAQAPELHAVMTRAVRNSQVPIFFAQPENDYDLAPSKTLSAAMRDAGKPFELKIYPPFGNSKQEGHTFGYFGSAVWAGDIFRFLEKYCSASEP